MGFAAKTTMKSHMVSLHDDSKYARFKCSICSKQWYEKGNYLKHKATAHKEKDPIKEMIKRGECIYPDCDKVYSGKHPAESVKYHLVAFHNDRKYAKYECEKCKKLFYDKTSHNKHMKQHKRRR